MAHYKITLFSNQRDPIRKWKAGSRLEALHLLGDVVAPECAEREKMGGFFVGEVVQIRIEQIQG